MDSSSSRRLPLRDLKDDGVDLELEEGEYVPGRHESSSDDTDDDGGYRRRLQPRREGEVRQEQGRRVSLLEEVMARRGGGRVALAPPRSITPPSCESDGTISDDDGNPTAASSAVVSVAEPRPPARRFACHVCGRRFISPKAVDGHMRVHGNARHAAAAAAVSGGWAVTGKRGWSGGKPSSVADSLNSDSNAHPLEPIPMAIAITSLPPKPPVLSTRTNLSGEESSSSDSAQPTHMAMATTLVSGAADPSITGAVIAHQHAAPPPASEPARPVHHPAVPPPPAPQRAQPPAMARPAHPPREYTCKLCGKSYTTHQGLGGHAAGHRNRQKELEAAAAAAGMMAENGGGAEFLAALRRGGRRAEERHECQKCHKVFHTGVALGGHMRMHYTGPPIVHKKHRKPAAMAAAVSEADLRLALSTITEERRPPAPAVVGRVRLFGIDIDIGQKEQAPPSEQQGSGEAQGSSSAANEQQQ